MEKVIPPGLNYADIKPEAIENEIRMIKFLPISNVQNQKANDVVRFHLQGNGFFDPYSAYIKIRVAYDMTQIPDATPAVPFGGVFLDRSAHSLINRLVIRSEGTELERIEQYDVMAAMINDMVYSEEQRELHSYEGFAYREAVAPNIEEGLASSKFGAFESAMALLNAEGPTEICSHFGDRGFFKIAVEEEKTDFAALKVGENPVTGGPVGSMRYALEKTNAFAPKEPVGLKTNGVAIGFDAFGTMADTGATTLKASDATIGWTNIPAAGEVPTYGRFVSPGELEFCIPIYSGILGVLMPDKKLLPMSLLPLEVEFTLNPHAFYPVGSAINRSNYTVKTFEIWTHTLFFEEELHRSLEAVVAQNGIFLPYKSFYLTPINSYNGTVIPEYHELGCFLKSVEAVHWVFLYEDYLGENDSRKLKFVSHNLYNLQLRNNHDLMPSEPIPSGSSRTQFGPNVVLGHHNQLMIEMYKAWNKMHDPMSDSAIHPFTFNIDNCSYVDADAPVKPSNYQEFLVMEELVGRCEYGISLVGEEIGSNETVVSGKKSVLPFDLNFNGAKSLNIPSIMLCYLRADFVVYVRPDLIVTRLGL